MPLVCGPHSATQSGVDVHTYARGPPRQRAPGHLRELTCSAAWKNTVTAKTKGSATVWVLKCHSQYKIKRIL